MGWILPTTSRCFVESETNAAEVKQKWNCLLPTSTALYVYFPFGMSFPILFLALRGGSYTSPLLVHHPILQFVTLCHNVFAHE